MGIVRMTTYSDDPDIQATFAYVYDYTYCDQCGSFNIGCLSTIPKAVVRAIWIIVLVYFVIITGAIIYITSYWYLGCLIGPISLIAFAFIVIKGNLIPTKLKCRKCGNEQITSENTLNYPENDKSVIDVPDHLTLKKHIQTYQV